MGVTTLRADPTQLTINPWSNQSIGPELIIMDNGIASQTMTANLAYAHPFTVGAPIVVNQLSWANGSAVSGNSDAGVYDEAGNALVRAGSTANSGTSTIQTVNVTDTTLGPGRYWLVYAADNSTQACLIANAVTNLSETLGIMQQSSAWSSGLPSTLTLAAPTVAQIIMVSFTARSAI